MGNEQSQGKGKKASYASMPVGDVPAKSSKGKRPPAGSSVAVASAPPPAAAAAQPRVAAPAQQSASTGTLVDLSGPAKPAGRPATSAAPAAAAQNPPKRTGPAPAATGPPPRTTASAGRPGAAGKPGAGAAAKAPASAARKGAPKADKALAMPSGPGASSAVFKNALGTPPAAPSTSQLHLNIIGAVACEAVLDVTIRTPNLQAKQWILYTAVPPITSFQVNGSVTAHLPSPASTPPACKVIRNDNGTELLQVVVNTQTHKHCSSELRIQFRFAADLFARELIYDPSFTCPYQVALPEEVLASTRQTATFNLSSAGLQALLQEFPSYYAPNVSGDEVVLFAQAVFGALANNFSYHFDPAGMDRSLDAIIAARKSDCAGLSILFCSILRKSGVPARCVAGRWIVQSSVQTHVISEFYVDQIGWIPVDVSLAARDGVVTKPDGRMGHFGEQPANFMAMHTNFDVELDTLHFGKQTVMHLLEPPFWVTGTRGVLDGKQFDAKWTVQKAQQLQG